MRGCLHCYYKGIYGIRPVGRKLQNTSIWLTCDFDRPSSRNAVDHFQTGLKHVVDDVFDQFIERAALCCIDPVNFDAQIEQFECSCRHVTILNKHTLATNITPTTCSSRVTPTALTWLCDS